MASKKLSNITATKAKVSKRADAKQSSKSAEYVEDSTDAESDSDEQSSPVTKSKTSSDKSAKPSQKEQSRGKVGEAEKKRGKGQEQQTNGAPKKVSSAEPSGSSDISDSDDDDSRQTSRPSGKAQIPAVSASQKARVQKEKSPSSSGGSSDEDDSDGSSETTAAAHVVMQDASEPARYSSRVAVARQTFTPPAGFKITAIPNDLGTRSLFTPENLSGKEIWHIVAPQNVPISAITAASLLHHQSKPKTSKLAPEETVATHKGTDYMLVEDDAPVHHRRAYRPDAGTEQYAVCKPSISRVLRLQRKSLFKFGETSTDASKIPVPETTVRVAPQQPQGLRMRYQPFGVSSNARLSRIRRPSELSPSLPSGVQRANAEKRKSSAGASVNANQNASAPSTKRRKHGHSSAEREDPPAAAKTELVDGDLPPATAETREERARLKTEHKAEKEERRARKAARRAKREADAVGAV